MGTKSGMHIARMAAFGCALALAVSFAAPAASLAATADIAGTGNWDATDAPDYGVPSASTHAEGPIDDESMPEPLAVPDGDDSAVQPSGQSDDCVLVPQGTGTSVIACTAHQDLAYAQLGLVNALRTNTPYSTNSIKWDSRLEQVAMQRAAETVRFWSHTRPDGTLPFTAFPSAMLTSAGENILCASTYSSAAGTQGAFDEWKGSSGHLANMVNTEFQSIGIACVEYNGWYFWVQEFSGTAGNSARETAFPLSGSCDYSITHPTGVATELAGDARCKTAVAIARKGWSSPKNVVLVYSQNFPDALAASSLTLALGSPILLTGSDGLDADTAQYLQDNVSSIQNVLVVGGTSVISDKVKSQVNKIFENTYPEGIVSRVWGTDRYQTALGVYSFFKQIKGEWSKIAIVTNGTNFADATSIAPVAAYTQSPIFLVDKKGNFTSDEMSIIGSDGFKTAIIVGGTSAVSSETESALVAKLGTDNVVRLGGADRYETSVIVAYNAIDWLGSFGYSMNNACYATGRDFPDALAGGAFAATKSAPVILVDNGHATHLMGMVMFMAQRTENPIATTATNQIYWLGGTSALSNEARQEVRMVLFWDAPLYAWSS